MANYRWTQAKTLYDSARINLGLKPGEVAIHQEPFSRGLDWPSFWVSVTKPFALIKMADIEAFLAACYLLQAPGFETHIETPDRYITIEAKPAE